ncbi:carbohydrate binding domain-containing protein [Hymenobacter metallilatus]|uniref:CBM-cenC domain-containing protein n=1 Tax=Hymenobacter metallilatus TaxID=2493666 RepID=A0A428JFC7_9BACT|nr:carbohydrate binding domain-containing protein [Hymenobacter metallilatus]RSK31163.1 hypothetical protein EI290_14170 [Hymenobacter metallilatus]
MNKLALGLMLLPALAACSAGSGEGSWVGDYVTRSDFESVVGWGGDAASLTKERAHSGMYSVKVDAGREYGQTFDVSVGQAAVHPLKGLELNAWALLLGPQATASVVLQIVDTSNNGFRVVHTEQLNLADQIKNYKEWKPVTQRFTLPPNLQPDYRLRIYLWRNTATEPAYLDDLSVKALE